MLALLAKCFCFLVCLQAHCSTLMDHCVFRFATRGQCTKGKKLDCFECNHVFCFKLQCASIVVLLCTAIWWSIVHEVGSKSNAIDRFGLLLSFSSLPNNSRIIFFETFSDFSNPGQHFFGTGKSWLSLTPVMSLSSPTTK